MINIERMVNQTLWYAIMYSPYQGENTYYENDVFIVRLYSWCETADEFDEKYNHDNSWHFLHKSSGLKLSWYKYPLRDVKANMDITHEQLYAVLQDCMNSVSERHPSETLTIIDSTFEKWW